jgi:hypothetical protein
MLQPKQPILCSRDTFGDKIEAEVHPPKARLRGLSDRHRVT